VHTHCTQSDAFSLSGFDVVMRYHLDDVAQSRPNRKSAAHDPFEPVRLLREPRRGHEFFQVSGLYRGNTAARQQRLPRSQRVSSNPSG
jgi:hypothetical protein